MVAESCHGEDGKMAEGIRVGDSVVRSPVGPGRLTGITAAGFPQVNEVAVAWLVAENGEVFDPHGVMDEGASKPC